MDSATTQLPGVFPSLEHHAFLRSQLRQSGFGNFTRQQRFEWQAYVSAWLLERQGEKVNPCDPNGEYHDPLLVKAARPLWAPKRSQRRLDPGDYSWAKPEDRARFAAQDRERLLFWSEFCEGQEWENGQPSQAVRDYVALCKAQALSNWTGRFSEKRPESDILATIRAELGVGRAA